MLFDFPNQGGGRFLEGSSYLNLDEQVDILDTVIKATIGEDHLSLCSASWGGVVALADAVRHPQQLNSLILASLGTRANQKMIEMITQGLETVVDRLQVAESIIENFGKDPHSHEEPNCQPVSAHGHGVVPGVFPAWFNGYFGERVGKGRRFRQGAV